MESIKKNWKKALVKSKYEDHNIIEIETWNEYHEGTNISESKEFWRKYLDLFKKYIEKFKNEEVPKNFSGKELYNSNEVSINFKNMSENEDIQYIEAADGKNEVVTFKVYKSLKPVGTEFSGKYMYFKLNSMYKFIKGKDII